jgi:hypothetical protein
VRAVARHPLEGEQLAARTRGLLLVVRAQAHADAQAAVFCKGAVAQHDGAAGERGEADEHVADHPVAVGVQDKGQSLHSPFIRTLLKRHTCLLELGTCCVNISSHDRNVTKASMGFDVAVVY